MAEPVFQPALFDRLADDARTVTRLRMELLPESLERLGVTTRDIVAALGSRGFREVESEAQSTLPVLEFLGVGLLVQPSELRNLPISAPGAVRRIRLHECGTLTATSSPNLEIDSEERRGLTMQRLRAIVRRDLNALLNTASLESVEDLTQFPLVARSVVNFGIRSLAGRDTESLDRKAIADRIRRSIECFEPRLSRVRVSPEERGTDEIESGLAFRIDAELWGQPFPLPLSLRTRIDADSGAIAVDDADRGG